MAHGTGLKVGVVVFCVGLFTEYTVGIQYTTDDIVDLSIPYITNQTVFWPEWPYSYERMDIVNDAADGIQVEAYGFMLAIHTGTHFDAPCHVRALGEDAPRMHEVPLERFFGPAAVIDIKEKVDGDRDYRMQMEDLSAWEEENGPVKDGAIVLVHTGWAKRYGDNQTMYWGTTNASDVDSLSYPTVHPEVAQFLVDQRNINALGMDAGTPDAPGESGTHLALLGNGRLIIENVAASLEVLPPTGYRIHAVPLSLHDTCGAPVRLLAHKESYSAASITHASMPVLLAALSLRAAL